MLRLRWNRGSSVPFAQEDGGDNSPSSASSSSSGHLPGPNAYDHNSAHLRPRDSVGSQHHLLGFSQEHSSCPAPRLSPIAPRGPAVGFSVLTGPGLAVSPLDTGHCLYFLPAPSPTLVSLESPSPGLRETVESTTEFDLMIFETESHLAQHFLWYRTVPGCRPPRLTA